MNSKVATALEYPVHVLALRVKGLKRLSHEKKKYLVGVTMMFVGGSLAFFVAEYHFPSGIVVIVHGTGMVPFANALVKMLKLE